jgi:hypothetical protein
MGWSRRRFARLATVAVSVALGLAIAEAAAAAAHDHAFPYLNLFTPDEAFGVRLCPNDQTRVRTFGGRTTSVRTNERGFRGGSWERAPRVLLLGDSQMFGLHVEESRATSALLSRALDAEVWNAAVPSWGPTEYVLAIEALTHGEVADVVFVANVANDWAEVDTPNTRRTTARDGWAVAAHPALRDRGGASFPGRAWLFGRSHLVYAARLVTDRAVGPAAPRAEPVDRLVDRLDELRARGRDGFRSRMTRHVVAARDACARLGCRLSLAVLPLDVQVYAGEWAKYRTDPRDLRATEVLAEDLLADARELGVPAIDLLPPLRRASPGAFLSDDYHLSARGHRAVARAIAAMLDGGAP